MADSTRTQAAFESAAQTIVEDHRQGSIVQLSLVTREVGPGDGLAAAYHVVLGELLNMRYDTVGLTLSFIEHDSKVSKSSFKQFQLDLAKTGERFQGGNCATLALLAQSRIRHSHFVYSEKDGNPHTALVVPYYNKGMLPVSSRQLENPTIPGNTLLMC